VKVLNDSKLLTKQIATVGQTKDAIVNAFVAGVQSIPDDQDGNWTGPAEVADYYGRIVVPDPPASAPPAAKAKATKPASAKPAPAPKPAKAPAEKKKGRIDVAADVLADLQGKKSIPDLVKAVGEGYVAAGGNDNPIDTRTYLKMALTVAERLGVITIDGDDVTKL